MISVSASCPITIANLAIGQSSKLDIEDVASKMCNAGMNVALTKYPTSVMSAEAISARLALIRVAYGLEKGEFADMLEIDRSHWSRFEGGQRAIPFDKAARIVARFGVSTDFIYLGRIAGMEFEVIERLRAADTQNIV